MRRLWDSALADEDIVGLSIGTRPDCISNEVLDLLQSYAKNHLIWVEYGLQSIHDATLDRINRGHDAAAFFEAVKRTRDRSIQICAHIIIGLPGESRRQVLQTAEALAGLPIQGVKLHLLYVIKGTPLDALYQSGGYTCLDETTYVNLVCDVLERLPAPMVIQRLTGEPHSKELRAPQWSLDKRHTLKQIKHTLESRGTWQGCRVPESTAFQKKS